MVSPPVREPYNAKARQSTTGSRKKRGKRKKTELTAESDPNVEILLPKSQDEKEKKDELLRKVLPFSLF